MHLYTKFLTGIYLTNSLMYHFRSPLLSDNNVTPNNINNNEVRHRTRVARNEAMQDKIREIKRKQKETESKKISLPKKRRSLLILSGVILVLSVFAYVYVKS